jgi:hypothetical protein
MFYVFVLPVDYVIFLMMMMIIADKEKQVDISGQAKVKNSIGTAEN